MAEERTIIAPIQFNGSANDDAEQWLKHSENYCAYKNYDEPKKLALCKILLTGNAAAWLDALPEATTGTWDALKEGFLQRYLTPEFMHFKSARLIFNTKMQPNDTVDEYVAKMQQLARTIKADEKTVRFAILNGLLPHIANYVTQKQPTTITEFLDAARIAELTHPVAAETDTAVTALLAGVQEQLRKLTAKWDNSVVASVNRPDESKRSWTPPRGQSPRRVRFSEDQRYPHRWSDTPNRPSRGFSTSSRYSFPRRGGRGTRYGGFSGFSGQYGMQSFNPQPAYDVQVVSKSRSQLTLTFDLYTYGRFAPRRRFYP